jgi:hypothetical protein
MTDEQALRDIVEAIRGEGWHISKPADVVAEVRDLLAEHERRLDNAWSANRRSEARVAELERACADLDVARADALEHVAELERLVTAMARRGDRMAAAIDDLLRRDVGLGPHATAPLRITRDAWRVCRKGRSCS